MAGRRATGSVTLRRGEYRVRLTVNGKRVMLPERFPNTAEGKRQAEDLRDEVRISRNRDEWKSPADLTVAEFAPRFLQAKSVKVRPNTLALYRTLVEAHVVPRLGNRRVSDVEPAHLLDFYHALLDDGLSVKSAHNVFSVTRQLFHVAVSLQVITSNPAVGVELGKKPKPQIKVWSPEETRRFLSGASEPIGTIGAVLATTGMRRSEILGLTWPAIDLDGSSLMVTATVVQVDNHPVFREMEAKTAGSLRSISLDGYTVARLRSLKASQSAQRLAMGELWQDTQGLVFTDEAGRILSPDRVTRQFQSEAKRLGLEPIGTKGLRHSWATTAMANGTHPKVVQERLGHSSISTTLDRYSHVSEEMDRAAAVAVADIIMGSGTP